LGTTIRNKVRQLDYNLERKKGFEAILEKKDAVEFRRFRTAIFSVAWVSYVGFQGHFEVPGVSFQRFRRNSKVLLDGDSGKFFLAFFNETFVNVSFLFCRFLDGSLREIS
ncbi:10283_t:CDS:2, partial [Funneliformis caledonium]